MKIAAVALTLKILLHSLDAWKVNAFVVSTVSDHPGAITVFLKESSLKAGSFFDFFSCIFCFFGGVVVVLLRCTETKELLLTQEFFLYSIFLC